MEKELQELRERLSRVEEWKQRREAIERELAQVWVEGGEELAPPPYAAEEEASQQKELEKIVPEETSGLSSGGIGESAERLESSGEQSHDASRFN